MKNCHYTLQQGMFLSTSPQNCTLFPLFRTTSKDTPERSQNSMTFSYELRSTFDLHCHQLLSQCAEPTQNVSVCFYFDGILRSGRDMNACAFRLQLAECGIADRTSRQAHKLVQPSVESCSEGKKSGEEQAEYNLEKCFI